MKVRIFAFLMASVIWALSMPAHAAEVEPEVEESQEIVTLETETDDKNIVVNVTVQAPAAVEATPEPVLESADSVPEETPSVYAVSTFRVVNDNSQPEEGSFAQTIVDLFGEYQPRTQVVTEIMSDGSVVTHEEIVPGLAGLDWQWLSEVLIFTVFLFCVMKLIGGLFK